MMGEAACRDGKLFYVGLSLDQRVPGDHPLRAIDRAIDFGFVREEVRHLYGRNGNVSLDPALVLRLMFLLYYENIRSERELMRQLPMRLDWLWFCKLDLDAPAPDHSVLSKARQRWGVEVFERVFSRVLGACVHAGLVGGDIAHADSTLLRAHAQRDGRVSRGLWEQLEHGLEPGRDHDRDDARDRGDDGGDSDVPDDASRDMPDTAPGGPSSPPRSPRAAHNRRLVSPTDPDAAIHTRRSVGTLLGYRDHRLVDDRRGVILATHATPADGDDGAQLPTLLDQAGRRLGAWPSEVTGDSQYGTRSNYELCARRGVRAYLKKRRGRCTPRVSWLKLLAPGCSPGRALHLLGRRRCVAEGSFAEAHERHNHRRCRWRRRWRVQIGCYLVAMVQNVKKLAKAGLPGRRAAVQAALGACFVAAIPSRAAAARSAAAR